MQAHANCQCNSVLKMSDSDFGYLHRILKAEACLPNENPPDSSTLNPEPSGWTKSLGYKNLLFDFVAVFVYVCGCVYIYIYVYVNVCVFSLSVLCVC